MSTGALNEEVVDYEDADRKLQISRLYRNKYASTSSYAPYIAPFGAGDSWLFNFQWQININALNFQYTGAIGIIAPDGAVYDFLLSTNGTVTQYNNGIADVAVQYVNPSGAAVTLASVVTSGGQFLMKTSSGDQILMGLFTANGSTQYTIGHPLQIIHRGGYTQNFSYGSKGELQSITDNLGRTITVGWYYASLDGTATLYPMAIQSITMPDGTVLGYTYSGTDGQQAAAYVAGGPTTGYAARYSRLMGFTRSQGSTVVDSATYIYDDPRMPGLLTGVIDNGGVRYATWQYDAAGHVISAQHANGADATTFAYSTSSNNYYDYRTVTNSAGKSTVYTFYTISSTYETFLTSVVGNASANCVGTTATYAYDSNKRISSKTDEAGHTTTYTYGTDGRPATVVEASGTTLQRATTHTWNSTFGVPTQIVKPGLTTTSTYDTSGRLLTVTQTDTTSTTQPYSTNGTARTVTYGYNAQGLLSSVDGPLAGAQDSTSFVYDAHGYLQQVTDGVGHVWQITNADAAGRPLTIVEPNGNTTTLAYDGAGRLRTRVRNGHTTSYSYDANGNLASVALSPEGSSLAYSYDSAHRLYEIDDNVGNRLHYTLDASGNQTRVDIYDPSSSLRRTQTRVYDELSRLLQTQDAMGQTTAYTYDVLGNATSITTMGTVTSTQQFDVLNRLMKVTDANLGVTLYGYDALDHLVSVTDPRGLVTRYTVDAFGDVIQVASPDTGTSVYTYDLAGNVAAKIDAKGQTTGYQYDLIYRLKQIAYGGTSTVQFNYDQGSNGAGHLTSMTDSAGSTSWSYDVDGHVVQKVQADGGATLTTHYGYDAAGRLASLTLPSGHVVGFSWNANHVASVMVDSQFVATQITSEPFGEPSAWSFANGEQVTRTFDLSGRMTANSLATLGYDTGNRITSLIPGGVNIGTGNRTYGYDLLDRLTSYSSTVGTPIAYSYDSDGNRTQQSGGGTQATINVSASNNRIASVTAASNTVNFNYDANGSTTADILNRYGYDASGRLSVANTASYLYDGKGQRTVKVTTSTATLYNYDEAGHLIGEYDVSGTPIEETVWLGDIPLATINSSGTYFIHADHLNTPRQIDDGNRKAVWAWDTLTYGASAPNQDPQSSGTPFTYNLRMPGQYYDAESGLFHNGWRDYDPSLGRYVESDLIGLRGGVDTYAYVGGNPISRTDPLGLAPPSINLVPGFPGMSPQQIGQYSAAQQAMSSPVVQAAMAQAQLNELEHDAPYILAGAVAAPLLGAAIEAAPAMCAAAPTLYRSGRLAVAIYRGTLGPLISGLPEETTATDVNALSKIIQTTTREATQVPTPGLPVPTQPLP